MTETRTLTEWLEYILSKVKDNLDSINTLHLFKTMQDERIRELESLTTLTTFEFNPDNGDYFILNLPNGVTQNSNIVTALFINGRNIIAHCRGELNFSNYITSGYWKLGTVNEKFAPFRGVLNTAFTPIGTGILYSPSTGHSPVLYPTLSFYDDRAIHFTVAVNGNYINQTLNGMYRFECDFQYFLKEPLT